jgi:cardiolipin synthase A/B
MATRTRAAAPGTAGHLRFFRWKLPLSPSLSKRTTILGIGIPRAGIIIVFALSLAALTIWGIVFTRAPQLITQRIEHRYDVADPAFLRSMGVLLGPPLAPGNRVDTLINGDQIFPAMLAAIRSAKKTITLETYIYWSGEVGKQFSAALAERARSGVKVHILVDWAGSHKMDQASRNEMGRAGAVILRYHEPRWYRFKYLNNRTHRKLLVIDGTVGFTGGVGIADNWGGNAQDKDHWRDTHYRVEGPVVAQLQAAFADNWTQASGDVLHGDDYFPALSPRGTAPAQVFKSSMDGGAESMQLMYLLAIAAAKSSIDISMAYFIPDSLAVEHLVAALKRGVRVRLIVPGKQTDSWLVRAASRTHWGLLLQHGAEIYEYEPTMYHCKMVVIDGLWSSVGSTNFDTRSFRLNDEANLNVYDREFAQRQVAEYERDLKHAKRVTYEEWKGRPWWQKAWDHTVAFFEPTLAG